MNVLTKYFKQFLDGYCVMNTNPAIDEKTMMLIECEDDARHSFSTIWGPTYSDYAP